MDELATSFPMDKAALSLFAATSKARVLSTGVTPLDLNGTVNLLLEMVRSKAQGYVCVANVHTTTLAVRDQRFRSALDGAAAVVADGMPIVWRVRAAGYPQAGRVYGADLVEATCAAGIDQGLRHGFFGGLKGVAEAMVCRLKERHPLLQIAGVWDAGLIKEGQKSPPDLLDTINKARCDILWVGLGAPKQEIWMTQHRSHLRVPAIVGVGQAFDIIAGRTVRAPSWMGAHGLEWLYRLVHEPQRLWKRYLIYNSLFLWYLLLERLGYSWYRPKI
jgi:N-acetylglucosaminyldiphosphoundecaprenol N-acetyl-beta-D-mannosaminyltransferase